MEVKIRKIKDTESLISAIIKQRDLNEYQTHIDYINDYHKLITKLESKNHQIKKLTSQFASEVQASSIIIDNTKLNQLQDENQKLYKKLAEK